ncbi:hypothetical protein B7486_56385, partial [cyanobacterium TDX16]
GEGHDPGRAGLFPISGTDEAVVEAQRAPAPAGPPPPPPPPTVDPYADMAPPEPEAAPAPMQAPPLLVAAPEPGLDPVAAPPPASPPALPDETDLGDRAAEAAARTQDAAARAAATAKDVGSVAAEHLATAGQNVSEASRTLATRRSKGVRNTPNRRRLRVELAVFSIELQAWENRTGGRQPWMDAADTLTLGAADAVRQHETIEAWSLLWAAQREAMDGMRDEELLAEGETAVREARYLLGNQHADELAKTVHAIGDDDPPPVAARVRNVRNVLDRQRIEVYRRLREEGRRLSGLSVLIIAFLVAAGLAVGFGVVDGGEGEALGGLDDFLAVAGFGACGAVISMLIPWASTTNRPAVLDFVNPIDLTVLRVATGAALAVALVAVLQVVELSDIVGSQAYPWAFVAGFGERTIDKRLHAVDAAARDTEAG